MSVSFQLFESSFSDEHTWFIVLSTLDTSKISDLEVQLKTIVIQSFIRFNYHVIFHNFNLSHTEEMECNRVNSIPIEYRQKKSYKVHEEIEFHYLNRLNKIDPKLVLNLFHSKLRERIALTKFYVIVSMNKV